MFKRSEQKSFYEIMEFKYTRLKYSRKHEESKNLFRTSERNTSLRYYLLQYNYIV